MANRIIVTKKGQEIQRIILGDVRNEEYQQQEDQKRIKSNLEETEYLLQQTLGSSSSSHLIGRVNKKLLLVAQNTEEAQQQMVDLLIKENKIDSRKVSPFVINEIQRYTHQVFKPLKKSSNSSSLHHSTNHDKTFNSRDSILNSLRKNLNQTNNTILNDHQTSQHQASQQHQSSYFNGPQNKEKNISQRKIGNIINENKYLFKPSNNENYQTIQEPYLNQASSVGSYQLLGAQTSRQVRKSEDISFLQNIPQSQKNLTGPFQSIRENKYLKEQKEGEQDQSLQIQIKVQKQQSQDNFKKNINYYNIEKSNGKTNSRGGTSLSQSQERTGINPLYIKNNDRQKLVHLNNSMNSSILQEYQDSIVIDKCNAILNCEARVDRILNRYKKHQEANESIEARINSVKQAKREVIKQFNSVPPKNLQELKSEYIELEEIMGKKDNYEEQKKERIYTSMRKKYQKVWKNIKFPQLTQKYKNIMNEHSNHKKLKYQESDDDQSPSEFQQEKE